MLLAEKRRLFHKALIKHNLSYHGKAQWYFRSLYSSEVMPAVSLHVEVLFHFLMI